MASRADREYQRLRARHPFVMVGSSQVYPRGRQCFVSMLDVLAGASATEAVVRRGGPAGDVIARAAAAPGDRMRLRSLWSLDGLHVELSQADAILMGCGTVGFDESLLVTSVSPAPPTGGSGGGAPDPDGLTADNLFSASSVTQDVPGAVKFPGGDAEYVSFGNVTAWDGATSFSLLYRVRPEINQNDDMYLAGRYNAPPNRRQWYVRLNDDGSIELAVSGNGTNYGSYKTALDIADFGVWNDLFFTWDGSNSADEVDLWVRNDTYATWTEVAIPFFFGTDNLAQLGTLGTATDELLGNALGGGAGHDSFTGEVAFVAYAVNAVRTPAEVTAMGDLSRAPGFLDDTQEGLWDRLYYLPDHLGDYGPGQVHGVFVP